MQRLFFLLAAVVFAQPALTAGDLSRQDPIEVTVELGSEDGEMVFQPEQLTFEKALQDGARQQQPEQALLLIG